MKRSARAADKRGRIAPKDPPLKTANTKTARAGKTASAVPIPKAKGPAAPNAQTKGLQPSNKQPPSRYKYAEK
jgi:hypothetical protein